MAIIMAILIKHFKGEIMPIIFPLIKKKYQYYKISWPSYGPYIFATHEKGLNKNLMGPTIILTGSKCVGSKPPFWFFLYLGTLI